MYDYNLYWGFFILQQDVSITACFYLTNICEVRNISREECSQTPVDIDIQDKNTNQITHHEKDVNILRVKLYIAVKTVFPLFSIVLFE